LHPSVVVVPVAVIVGAVRSNVQLTVLAAVELLPQASVAVQVLVCDLEHPLLTTAPSVDVTVGELQPSVAVAVPSEASICAVVGLHAGRAGAAFKASDGDVRSTVHDTVLDIVAVLPHPSLAVQVLVCVLVHPLLCTVPSADVVVVVPQASVAV